MPIFESIYSAFSYIGPFTLLIGILVFVHELGHYAVAKFCGVRVETFSLGFGKKILQFKKGDTTYCLSLIPLGGYVKMYGDDPNKEIPIENQDIAFLKKPVLQRIAIVAAGPLMNLFFAFFIYLIIAYSGEKKEAAVIGDIEKTEYAYQIGFRPNDKIIEVDGVKIDHWEKAIDVFSKKIEKEVNFTVLRNDLVKQITAKTKMIENPNIFSEDKNIGWIEGLSPNSKIPLVGISSPSSLAYKSGLRNFDKVLSVNEEPLLYFRDLEAKLLQLKGQTVTLKVQKYDFESSNQKSEIRDVTIKVSSNLNNLKDLGLYDSETFILKLNQDLPAFKAGLKEGDRLQSINNKTISSFMDVLNIVKSYNENDPPLEVTVEREGELISKSIVPKLDRIKNEVKPRFFLGLVSANILSPPELVVIKHTGFVRSLKFSWKKTIEGSKVMFLSLYKIIQNKISPKNLSSVLTIGVMAKQSFNVGLSTFLKLMALLSLNLFIINLLPIPVLDGGHLLFFTIEAIKGGPISMEKMMLAQQIGVFIILGLMLFAFFNDITNLFFSAW